MYLPPLRAILAFEVAARLGSISKAADELNLTISAVSHQIGNLEAFVGRKLFDRTPRGLTLTSVGERYRLDIAGALAVIASASQNAIAADGVETLRLHVAPSFASLWLMPRLPSFRSAHPDIRVQLSAAHTHSDFSRGEVDLDIRYGAIRWGDLNVETIFSEEMLPLVSPRVLERLDVRAPDDLLHQELIFSEVNFVQWPGWFAAQGVPMSPSIYALRFDRAYHCIDAAIQGLGIALESSKLAAGALSRGELVPVFPDRKGLQVHAHHLVYPAANGQRSKVAKFVRWIRREAAQA